jgi:hypothetical protein
MEKDFPETQVLCRLVVNFSEMVAKVSRIRIVFLTFTAFSRFQNFEDCLKVNLLRLGCKCKCTLDQRFSTTVLQAEIY